MAMDFIVITRTNRPNMGNLLISAASQLKALRELIDGINDAAGHQFNGGDYTKFISQFGVDTADAANAVSLLGLINNIFNTTTEVTGANRIAQMDEFQARLAGQ